jgi:hypothetical protein
MKLTNSSGGIPATKRGEGGSITIIFIVLLAIMMILVTAEMRALANLHREVKFLEHQQIKRLNVAPTNSVAVSITGKK